MLKNYRLEVGNAARRYKKDGVGRWQSLRQSFAVTLDIDMAPLRSDAETQVPGPVLFVWSFYSNLYRVLADSTRPREGADLDVFKVPIDTRPLKHDEIFGWREIGDLIRDFKLVPDVMTVHQAFACFELASENSDFLSFDRFIDWLCLAACAAFPTLPRMEQAKSFIKAMDLQISANPAKATALVRLKICLMKN